VTSAVAVLPDTPYSFGVLQAAQAAGDRRALADPDRTPPHLLHLTGRAAGLEQLRKALSA
jgi:glucose-6-phosphate isomerase